MCIASVAFEQLIFFFLYVKYEFAIPGQRDQPEHISICHVGYCLAPEKEEVSPINYNDYYYLSIYF